MDIVKDFFDKGRCLIIAEVAQAHDGSLGMAHAYIDAAAKAGADAIKFQTHIADAESTPEEPWRVKFSYQDDLRFDYWKRMEFTEEQWAGLKQHADEKGIMFLSSPFSIEAVDMLERIGMPAWKIASGELASYPMLERIYATGKPVLISSGMSQLNELDALTATLKEKNIPFGVFQCTSSYPTPAEKVGLNMLEVFRQRYNCPVGLSDHSGKIYPALAGVALGMDMLELHITFDKGMFGPDVVASITVAELATLVEGMRFIEAMKANPVVKDEMAANMQGMRNLFTKSIVAKRNLPKGTIISEEDLAYKKPGTGIPAAHYKNLIGKELKQDVEKNFFFKEDSFNQI